MSDSTDGDVYKAKFYSKFNNFRLKNKYCDVIIEVRDRTFLGSKFQFPCSQMVLAATSPYFEDIFSVEDFEELCDGKLVDGKSKVWRVDTPSVSAQDFEQILGFIYEGSINVNNENCLGLLTASDCLSIADVEDIVTAYIEKNLPVNNMFDLLNFAVSNGKAILTPVLCEFICNHFVSYVSESTNSNTTPFVMISYEALKAILQCKDFVFSDFVMDTILNWVNENIVGKKLYLPKIIEMVDLEKLSTSYVKLLLKHAVTAAADGKDDTSAIKMVEDVISDRDHLTHLEKAFATLRHS